MSLTRLLSVLPPCHDGLDIFFLLGVQRAGHAAGQMFGETQDGVQRRAQFVGDMLDEVGLEAVGGFQPFVAVAQRVFDAEAVGDVVEGHQGGAVGQRRRWTATGWSGRSVPHRPDRAPWRPCTMAWINWSQIALSPNLSRDSAAMVRTCGSPSRSSALEFPDAGEGGIVQLQLAVGTEHRHAFAQRVQRGGLHLHQGVVVAFQGRCAR